MRKLILIRGLPGSGKTTLAKQLNPDAHFEADMYFYSPAGVYHFDSTKLSEAHSWCFTSTMVALCNPANQTVIVSNTFVQRWEMQRYIDLAKKCQVKVEILVCNGNYQNIHGVPQETIERMRSRWEDHLPLLN